MGLGFRTIPTGGVAAPPYTNGPYQYSENITFANGFKMKWHNMGNSKNQIRLSVGIMQQALLFEAYVKQNSTQEKRMLARFKTHLQQALKGHYSERGRLP